MSRVLRLVFRWIGTTQLSDLDAFFVTGSFGVPTPPADDLPLRLIPGIRCPLPNLVPVPRQMDVTNIGLVLTLGVVFVAGVARLKCVVSRCHARYLRLQLAPRLLSDPIKRLARTTRVHPHSGARRSRYGARDPRLPVARTPPSGQPAPRSIAACCAADIALNYLTASRALEGRCCPGPDTTSLSCNGCIDATVGDEELVQIALPPRHPHGQHPYVWRALSNAPPMWPGHRLGTTGSPAR